MHLQTQQKTRSEPIVPQVGTSMKDYAKDRAVNTKLSAPKEASPLRVQIFKKESIKTEDTSSSMFQIRKPSNANLTPKEKPGTLNKIEYFHSRSAIYSNKTDSASLNAIDTSNLNTPVQLLKSSASPAENKFNFLKVAHTLKNSPNLGESFATKRHHSQLLDGFLPKILNSEKTNSYSNASSADSVNSLTPKDLLDSRISNLLLKSQVNPSQIRDFNIEIINEKMEEQVETRRNKGYSSFLKSRLNSARDWDQAYTPIYRRLGIELVQKLHPSAAEEHLAQPIQGKESAHLGISFLKDSLITSPRGMLSPRKSNLKMNCSLKSMTDQTRNLKGKSIEFQNKESVSADISNFQKKLSASPKFFGKVDLEPRKRSQELANKN